MTPAVPVILDCDPGHDDALAILLAAAHPAIDLRAITTVSGNGSLDKVTHNAARICTLIGLHVPIAAGANEPLAGRARAAPTIHGDSALDGPALPDPTVPVVPTGAAEFIASQLRESAQPITIVATGPLTNIALVLRDHPEVTKNIERIVFMGGSIGRGNWTPAAEFNIWVDPEAAAAVVNSGIPLAMAGLDVTHLALATPAVIERISALGTPLARVVVEWLTFFAGTYRDVFAMPDPPVHDPVAIAMVAASELVTTGAYHVDVELDGTFTRGATLVDIDRVTGGEPNVEVATDLDVAGFWDLLVDAVRELGRS